MDHVGPNQRPALHVRGLQALSKAIGASGPAVTVTARGVSLGVAATGREKCGQNPSPRHAAFSLWPRTLTRAAPIAATILLAVAVWGGQAQAQPAVPSLPTIQNGYGTLAVSNSSINVSTVTVSPNSAAWLMPLFGNLVVQNAGTGNLYLCFFGGTCSSSNGWKIAPGASLTVSLGGRTVSPTIISDTSSTAIVGW